ncbi:MAG: single-stranded-DNA-specific exonuclease RecJ [Planctomycetota bacterium]|nr:MAG: single-stranded-DNA-specific exonuclease RecJ [Planctomycetota bacterium]
MEIDPLMARCLVLRGVRDAASARDFLQPSIDELLDPFELPDMDTAAQRFAQALLNHETVLIHGDADVDGLSGTALLAGFLRSMSCEPVVHVPNRAFEDYSFNARSLQRVADSGATLVISVDNGTTSIAPIAELQARGVDVIVTDHHLPEGELPAALAVVNPVRSDSTYPNRALAGVGVAFKLCCATATKLHARQQASEGVSRFLGEALAWVAMGTVSDIMTLQGENRMLVSRGLRAIAMSTSPGLKALRKVAGIGSRCEAEDIAFRIAPRLNAASRMGRSELSVELVTATDPNRARELAQLLDDANKERQSAERQMLMDLAPLVEAIPPDEAVVLAGEGWNPGLLGLACGRLARARGTPAVLVNARADGPSKGSSRSVPGFDVHAALGACEHHLLTFGGHRMAAGFAMDPANMEGLRRDFQALWTEHQKHAEAPPHEFDGELPLAAVTEGLVKGIERLAPFGEGNRRPVLGCLGVRVIEAKRMGGDGSHLTAQLAQGPMSLRAVAFGAGDRVDELPAGAEIDILFTPKINRFRGRANVELELVDLRPRTGPR